tara:strand:- start:105 stop:329 length:225 start_codon:yes stop_codon:yes gene_type:complete
MNYQEKHGNLILSEHLLSKLSPANQAKFRRLPAETQEMILEAALEEGQIKIESRVKREEPYKLSQVCEDKGKRQ